MKHSDLPDAVPVVTIVGPAQAAAQRLRLVGVEPLDARALQRREHVGVQLRRGSSTERRRAGALARLAHQPPVRAAVVQQGAPGVLHEFFRHGPLG